jgi:hypothetical protein
VKIEIEKGIPTERPKGGAGGAILEALKVMEVGDSFFLPAQSGSVGGQIYTLAGIAGVKIKRKKWDNGYRVWRKA